MTFQDVPDSLITHLVTDVRQCAGNSVIAPGPVLCGKAYDEFLYFLVDPRATWILTLLGPVEFLRDQPPVPTEYRLRLYDIRDFLKRRLAELLTDLSKDSPLAVGELQSTRDLSSQDAVLPHQVLIAEQKLLVDGTRDIRQ